MKLSHKTLNDEMRVHISRLWADTGKRGQKFLKKLLHFPQDQYVQIVHSSHALARNMH